MRPIVPSSAMTELEAFYLPLGDGRYAPTRATESPWDRDAQHGGPPAALLAHLIDQTTGDALRLARLSIDFLGAIPRRELSVTVTPIRPGRRISLSQAEMTVDDRTVAIARTWHIATGPQPPIDDDTTHAPPLPPEQPQQAFFGLTDWGYGEAIEWRFTEGGFDTPGRAGAWTRVKPALVAGEPITPIARTLIAADSANGRSSTLPLAHDDHVDARTQGRVGPSRLPHPAGAGRHRARARRSARRARLPRRGRPAAADLPALNDTHPAIESPTKQPSVPRSGR
jgi:hypothetical protein